MRVERTTPYTRQECAECGAEHDLVVVLSREVICIECVRYAAALVEQANRAGKEGA